VQQKTMRAAPSPAMVWSFCPRCAPLVLTRAARGRKAVLRLASRPPAPDLNPIEQLFAKLKGSWQGSCSNYGRDASRIDREPQIVHHAGPALAGQLYVAAAKKGLAHCVRALELMPESIGLRFGCGISPLSVGRGAYGRQAAELMRAALRLPPRDSGERLVQRQA
jgi:hypothetical protein